MIRALLIDWGAVLMRTVDVRPRMAWERRLRLPPGALADMVFGGSAWQLAQQGEATLDDVWAEVGQKLKLDKADVAVLKRDFWAGDRLDEALVDLLRQMRQQGLLLALLSNHSAALPALLTELGLDGLFDLTVVSALEGVMKPDPAIYRRALERLWVAPEEAIFIDDTRINVEAARQLGMVGIHFRGLPHLRRALAAAGLSLPPSPPVPPPPVRAVVFDWGGVLAPLTFMGRTHEWEERLGLQAGELERVLWGAEWKLLETGAISAEAFDAHVARRLRLPDREAVRAFYQAFYADEHLEPRVVAAVRALRPHYAVALLTNAFPGHADLSVNRYGFDPRAEFDLYINSAEVGLAKPDPAIYRLVLDRLDVSPQQAVLVDDMLRNTDGAAALGMHTVTFTDVETGLAELAALLNFPLS